MGIMSRPGNDDHYGQILSTTLMLDSKVTAFPTNELFFAVQKRL